MFLKYFENIIMEENKDGNWKNLLFKECELGRVVLPIEIRKKLEINEADKLKIYTEGGRVIIENKYII